MRKSVTFFSVAGIGALVVVAFAQFHLIEGKINHKFCSSRTETQKLNKFPRCAVSVDYLANEGPYYPGPPDDNFIEEYPDWFDPEFAAIGQKFGQRNIAGIVYGKILLTIFAFADREIEKVIRNKGHFTTHEGAFQGVLKDVFHEYMWIHEDILGNKSNLFQSWHSVRSKHLIAASKANLNDTILEQDAFPNRKPWENPANITLRVWKAFDADLRASGLKRTLSTTTSRKHQTGVKKVWLNQYGMSVTHFALVGLVVLRPEQILISKYTETELEAYLHLWALLGKAVGVEDEYNICLQPDLKTARLFFKRYFEDHMIPSLFHMSYAGKSLFENIVQGANNLLFAEENHRDFKGRSILAPLLVRVLEDVLGVESKNLRSVMTPGELAGNLAVKSGTRQFKRMSLAGPYLGKNALRFIYRLVGQIKFGFDAGSPSEVADKSYL